MPHKQRFWRNSGAKWQQKTRIEVQLCGRLEGSTIKLTSSVLPEGNAAVFLGQIGWLEAVLVLESSVGRSAIVAVSKRQNYRRNCQEPPHLRCHFQSCPPVSWNFLIGWRGAPSFVSYGSALNRLPPPCPPQSASSVEARGPRTRKRPTAGRENYWRVG